MVGGILRTLGVTAVVAGAGFLSAGAIGSERSGSTAYRAAATGSGVTPAVTRSAGAVSLSETLHQRLVRLGAQVHAKRNAESLTPLRLRASSGDGIDLIAPSDGSSWIWSSTGYLQFSWYEGWYCPGCDGVEVLLVMDTQSNVVAERDGVCPASNAPSCPTSAQISLNPGVYRWGVGVQLGSNPQHVSDIWTFEIVAPTGPTTTAPPPATSPTTVVAPTAPTTATTTTTSAPPAAPATTTTDASPTTTTTTTVAPAQAPRASPVCRVPMVRGMTLANAQLRIFNANCSIGAIARAYSAVVAKGRVITSSPPAGAVRKAGSSVRILLSLGQPKTAHSKK